MKSSNYFNQGKKILLFAIAVFIIINFFKQISTSNNQNQVSFNYTDTSCWVGAGIYEIPDNIYGDSIRYGRDLIAHTAKYFGPKGSVKPITNGMNCQNCHLDAGTKPWGNNYGAVAANYPLFRDRSGIIETIEKRINDCLERSLNGSPINEASLEMKAMVAYIKWLGKEVPIKTKPNGTGIQELVYLNRAADPEKGNTVFINHCERCHGKNGEGKMDSINIEYTYPPLWGNNSYNVSAGLFRLTRFAGFVKNNMPNTVNYRHPELSNEEAWDVAAFVNSQPRPNKKFKADWPNTSKKPMDYPFGPYADSLTESQHKYGPWKQ
jgi:thiosulfate dehydrogenase